MVAYICTAQTHKTLPSSENHSDGQSRSPNTKTPLTDTSPSSPIIVSFPSTTNGQLPSPESTPPQTPDEEESYEVRWAKLASPILALYARQSSSDTESDPLSGSSVEELPKDLKEELEEEDLPPKNTPQYRRRVGTVLAIQRDRFRSMKKRAAKHAAAEARRRIERAAAEEREEIEQAAAEARREAEYREQFRAMLSGDPSVSYQETLEAMARVRQQQRIDEMIRCFAEALCWDFFIEPESDASELERDIPSCAHRVMIRDEDDSDSDEEVEVVEVEAEDGWESVQETYSSSNEEVF